MSSHSFGRQSLSPCFRLVMDVHITLHYDLLLRHHEGLRTMDMKVSSRFSAGAMSAFALAILMAGCVGGASLTASAAPFTITGTGRVVCDSVTGSVKLTPALVAGLTGQVTARVKLVGTSCGKAGASTGDGLHVTKMVIKGLLTVPGDRTCLVGDTQSQIPGSGGFKITYVAQRGTPKLYPTNLGVGSLQGVSATEARLALSVPTGVNNSFAQPAGGVEANAYLIMPGLCGKSWLPSATASSMTTGSN